MLIKLDDDSAELEIKEIESRIKSELGIEPGTDKFHDLEFMFLDLFSAKREVAGTKTRLIVGKYGLTVIDEHNIHIAHRDGLSKIFKIYAFESCIDKFRIDFINYYRD